MPESANSPQRLHRWRHGTKQSTLRELYGAITKTTCVVGVWAFLYVAILLAISPCASDASIKLSDSLLRTPLTPAILSSKSFLPPLPHLAVTGNAVAPTTLECASKITDIIKSAFGIVALIVGGVFAYWKFFMGRTLHPRLEPAVTATARIEANQVFLNVSCKLKNVGLSSIDLNREDSLIRILFQDLVPAQELAEIQWPKKSTLGVDVFKNHEWIEGGETIEDAHMFVFPYVPNRACRIELHVFRIRRNMIGRFREWNRRRKRPNAWTHHAIVDQFVNEEKKQTQETR
jgi:hypothetical protein